MTFCSSLGPPDICFDSSAGGEGSHDNLFRPSLCDYVKWECALKAHRSRLFYRFYGFKCGYVHCSVHGKGKAGQSGVVKLVPEEKFRGG